MGKHSAPKKRYLAAGVAVVGAAAASVALAGSADAAHSIVASKDNPVVWGCINPATNATVGGRLYLYDGSNTYPGCATWATKVYWSEKGNNGDTDALVPATTSGVTQVSNWAETSGWANDNFTRTVNITRKNEVDANKCGPDAAACWFYTATLADNGSFTTVPGKASPNPSDPHTLPADAFNGSFIGSAQVEFYASTNKADGTLIPAARDGRGSGVGTSDWVKQAFPSGTKFGSDTLTSYAWDYTTACERWHDSIVPGDDGAGAADGNITMACAS